MAVMRAVPALAIASSAVTLGFGSQYHAPDGSVCVHRGMDVSASAGSDFGAPVAGEVRFAGRVPGPHGGSVQAVTIETATGLVSLMPFERLEVSKGESVSVGECVGAVAATGDPSTDSAHVHVSLRHGDLYVDPAVLLEVVPAPQQPEIQPSPVVEAAPVEAAPEPPAVRSASAVDSPASAGVAVMGTGVSLAPQASAVSAGEGVQAEQPIAMAVQTPATVGDVGVQSGVSVVSAGASARAQVGASDSALSGSWSRLLGQVRGLSAPTLAQLASAAAPVSAALALVLGASIYLLGRRSFERRLTAVSPVSYRLGRLLQQLRAGDTLRGLTSCSGHAAFTVPEPSSPEEVTK